VEKVQCGVRRVLAEGRSLAKSIALRGARLAASKAQQLTERDLCLGLISNSELLD